MDDRETDEQVMARLAEGNTSALRTLIERWGAAIWCFIQRFAGPLGMTDDLYQEVWTRLFLYRRDYFPGWPLRQYLFGIAANCCRTALRSRRRWHPVAERVDDAPADALVSRDPPPVDRVIADEERVRLYRAIDRLPLGQRQVVLLYCLQTTNYVEIANTLGKTAGTVRSHMHQALINLRAILTRISEGEVGHAGT